MAMSSLVVHITDDDAGRAALAFLAADGRCTLGPHHAGRHALVLDTADEIEATAFFQQLERTPGIAQVQLVAAWFDAAPQPTGVGATYL